MGTNKPLLTRFLEWQRSRTAATVTRPLVPTAGLAVEVRDVSRDAPGGFVKPLPLMARWAAYARAPYTPDEQNAAKLFAFKSEQEDLPFGYFGSDTSNVRGFPNWATNDHD
jgi:hypothetical protein